MKKMISFMMTLTMIFPLAACGNSESTEESSSSPETSSQTENFSNPDESTILSEATSQTEESAQPETDADSKSLVVYFSHSGNTESVANEIVLQTGADIFAIVPETPYTTDYDTLLDVAQEEQRNNERPKISGTIDNFDDYDTVYLGYPNWWADMPMVVYTFLDTYDLSGKTISPFVTSGGSGFSDTISTIESMEPDAVMTEGLAIRDSDAGNPADAVSAWLENLK